MKQRRPLSLLIVLSLLACLLAPSAGAASKTPLAAKTRDYGGQFADVTGAWCEPYVRTCYEAGLLDGLADGSFGPREALTHAQIFAVTARLKAALEGDTIPAGGQPWYRPYVDYLAAKVDDTTEAGAYLLYDLEYAREYAAEPCDRYDFVWYLAAVLPKDALSGINRIADLPDTSDEDVLTFYRAGILMGVNDYGTFNGLSTLTRAEAAAMLARIADPDQRVSFAPKKFVPARELLGMAPGDAVYTIDGCIVTAELYAASLASSLLAVQTRLAYSYYDKYEDYCNDWAEDDSYTEDFDQYLLEKYGIQVGGPVQWDEPDADGVTPAQRALDGALDSVTQVAVLLSRQDQYPLTRRQEQEIKAAQQTGGDSLWRLTAAALVENLAATFDGKAGGVLEDQGYLYGQAVLFSYGEYGDYASAAAAKTAAQEARNRMAAHLDDDEYLEFLFYKYESVYSSFSAFSLEKFPEAARNGLKGLKPGQLSPVLEGGEAYLLFYCADPDQDESLGSYLSYSAAMNQIAQWAETAKAESAVPGFPASLDLAAAAAALAEYLGN